MKKILAVILILVLMPLLAQASIKPAIFFRDITVYADTFSKECVAMDIKNSNLAITLKLPLTPRNYIFPRVSQTTGFEFGRPIFFKYAQPCMWSSEDNSLNFAGNNNHYTTKWWAISQARIGQVCTMNITSVIYVQNLSKPNAAECAITFDSADQ